LEGSRFQASLGKKKFIRPPYQQKKAGHVACTCHSSYSGRHIKEDHGPGWPGKKQDSISKLSRTKRAGGVAQAVQHLPSKQEAKFKLQYHQQKRKIINKILATQTQ
jgi:hypothetical protein